MRCNAVLPLLSDLADHSLSPFTALRVRRHLRTCAACQSAGADSQTFDQAVRALHADRTPLPPGLRTRVLSAAPVSIARPVFRRRSLTQIAVAGLCVAACLFAVAALVHFSNAPARPSVAFAQVEAAMQNLQTVHWIETNRSSTNFGEGAPLGPARISEQWARLDPPVLVVKQQSSPTPESPHTVKNTFHSVIDGQQQIVYNSFDDTYTITHFGRREKEGGVSRAQIIKSIIVSEAISPGAAANYLRTTPKNGAANARPKRLLSWLPKSSPLKSSTVTEAGRSLILFERTQQPWKRPSSGGHGLSFGRVTVQTWVEPDTHRVVRYERTQYAPNGRDIQFHTMAEQFRYNENLPPSTWVLVPPPGAKVKREEQSRSQSVTLTASEKQKIQAVINASDAGWRTGNFAAFASVWDFGELHARAPSFDPGPVRRQQWAFRVSHQKNNWAEWRSVIVGASMENHVAGVSFAPNAPDVLQVDVTVTGKPKRGSGREWSGPAAFYLNRTKTGAYTVVEWEHQSLWRRFAQPSLMAR